MKSGSKQFFRVFSEEEVERMRKRAEEMKKQQEERDKLRKEMIEERQQGRTAWGTPQRANVPPPPPSQPAQDVWRTNKPVEPTPMASSEIRPPPDDKKAYVPPHLRNN